MKVIAMYLPQFHEVEDNNKWWGDGFTDWVSAKKAKPLFEGHNQPNVPLDDNYYDLMDINTLKWQSDLMKKYMIDGLCFYHYYFKDGKKILEKPAELLLKNKEIDMPFCFCWANETWARSWSNVKNANVWSAVEEPKNKEGKEVLLEQSYGEYEDWKKHILYLIDFFKDDRYIKIDNKPLFLIYKPDLIIELQKMITTWKEVLEEAGIEGIYVIGMNNSPMSDGALDAILFHEPTRSLGVSSTKRNENGLLLAEYDEVWNKLIQGFKVRSKKTYFGGFVKYDDTPRRGNGGVVIQHASAKSFEKNLTKLFKKNEEFGNEITFINAWNEWGEGMYLEPDKKDGYDYLDAIVNAKKNYLSEKYEEEYNCMEYILYIEKQNTIHKLNMNILDRMLELKEERKSLTDWFVKNGYKNVAVYGYGILGKHLIYEIESKDIEIRFVIDQNRNVKVNYPLYSLDDDLPDVDVIVVCVPYYYGDIIKKMEKTKIKIVSIQTIIEELDDN